MSSVHILGLTKRYGTAAAAFEVSFDLRSGGTLALLGPSGCGKTTVLRCLAGLETPDWGTIEIDGTPVFDRDRGIDIPAEQRGLGIVFRSFAVWPHMTVAENVAFPLKVRGVAPAERRDRANRMLERVGLKGFEDRPATPLSAEQMFRVALARALVHEPGLVLFDDALAGLDPRARQPMRTELRMLREQLGFTAIYVTHDQAEAFSLADDILLMHLGGIETAGAARSVVRYPNSAYTARFFGMNVLEGRLLGPSSDNRYLEVELSDRLVVRGVAAPGQELQEGGRVLACIRREAVRVRRAEANEDAAGVIVAASFLGTGEEYLIDIAEIRLAAAGPESGLVKGDRIHVTMTPDEWVFVR